jgi:hypothetical protein
MKTLLLFVALSLTSCILMVATDNILGEKAEFLNASNAFERLLGKEPTASESYVAKKFGLSGELTAVLLVNLAIGLILTILVKALIRIQKG